MTRTIVLYVLFQAYFSFLTGGTQKTFPDRDSIVPQIQGVWNQCRHIFGDGNIIIVSNSAGTSWTDPGGIQVWGKRAISSDLIFEFKMKSSVNQ